jgi:hypothetical protein
VQDRAIEKGLEEEEKKDGLRVQSRFRFQQFWSGRVVGGKMRKITTEILRRLRTLMKDPVKTNGGPVL